MKEGTAPVAAEQVDTHPVEKDTDSVEQEQGTGLVAAEDTDSVVGENMGTAADREEDTDSAEEEDTDPAGQEQEKASRRRYCPPLRCHRDSSTLPRPQASSTLPHPQASSAPPHPQASSAPAAQPCHPCGRRGESAGSHPAHNARSWNCCPQNCGTWCRCTPSSSNVPDSHKGT